ncbi:MAG: SseB family protein [Microbacterium sp.]
MSPATDPSTGSGQAESTGPSTSSGRAAGPVDSAGQPWAGRSFHQNPAAGDDGTADAALWRALTDFRAGEGTSEQVVEALRTARMLVPLVAEKGEEGMAPSGLVVDKTQELSIVTVSAPDGRTVMPLFTCTSTMRRWDAKARPIPVASTRAALAAVGDETDLIVIDPTSPTEFVVRRPAVWALARGEEWQSAAANPDVFLGLQDSIATELAVLDVQVADGDPQALLRGPELIVRLTLAAGLERAELDAILARLARRWAADDRIATLVDSLQVSLGGRAP